MAQAAAILDASEKFAWAGDRIQLEPVGEADHVSGGWAFGAGQQP